MSDEKCCCYALECGAIDEILADGEPRRMASCPFLAERARADAAEAALAELREACDAHAVDDMARQLDDMAGPLDATGLLSWYRSERGSVKR